MWSILRVDKNGTAPEFDDSEQGTAVDLTLGLRPLGLSPGSQGSAAWQIVFSYALKVRRAHLLRRLPK